MHCESFKNNNKICHKSSPNYILFWETPWKKNIYINKEIYIVDIPMGEFYKQMHKLQLHEILARMFILNRQAKPAHHCDVRVGFFHNAWEWEYPFEKYKSQLYNKSFLSTLQLPFDATPKVKPKQKTIGKTNNIIYISGITPDMNHRNKLITSTNQFAPNRNSLWNDPRTRMINKKRIGEKAATNGDWADKPRRWSTRVS